MQKISSKVYEKLQILIKAIEHLPPITKLQISRVGFKHTSHLFITGLIVSVTLHVFGIESKQWGGAWRMGSQSTTGEHVHGHACVRCRPTASVGLRNSNVQGR
jgi:hypothetical protein